MKKLFIGISITVVIVVTIIFGSVNTEIIDEVNVVAAIGFDRADGKKIKGTAVIPVYLSDKSIENASFMGESVLAKEIVNVLQKQSADPLVTGGLRVALYEDELAKQGILRYIDALQRDSSIGSRLHLGVVEGKTKDVLVKNLGNRGTGEYLSTIIEHGIEKRDVPKSDLHTFMYRHYMEGMDPYLPVLKLLDDKMEIVGLALFSTGKMVSKLNDEKLFFFKMLVENYGQGSYTMRLDGTDDFVSIKRIKTKRKIFVEDPHGEPKVKITIKFEGTLSEFSGQTISPDIIKQITKELETIIKDKTEEMFTHFQKENIDPVGIGYTARHSTRNLDYEKFKTKYPNLKIEVDAKVLILETGIVE